jgi:hypothetical protein
LKKTRQKEVAPERERQAVPVDIVSDLLQSIRGGFYPDSFGPGAEYVRWQKDIKFLQYKVILWPAAWLNSRGVTLKPDRFKEIILEVIQEIKIHGQTCARKWNVR